MAAWLIAALSLLGGVSGLASGRTLAPFTGGPPMLLPAGGIHPDGSRRRRRRRALTASDRADIAFIESILGKAAGKSFAMIIATRT